MRVLVIFLLCNFNLDGQFQQHRSPVLVGYSSTAIPDDVGVPSVRHAAAGIELFVCGWCIRKTSGLLCMACIVA